MNDVPDNGRASGQALPEVRYVTHGNTPSLHVEAWSSVCEVCKLEERVAQLEGFAEKVRNAFDYDDWLDDLAESIRRALADLDGGQ